MAGNNVMLGNFCFKNNKLTFTDIQYYILVICYGLIFFPQVFDSSSLTYIITIISLVIMFITYLVKNKGIITVKFTYFHFALLLFLLICFISSNWSIIPFLSNRKSIYLFKQMILIFSLYICYQDFSVNKLLKANMWGCYIFVIALSFCYGWQNLMYHLLLGARMGNDVLNVNVIGMMGAYAIIINLFFMSSEGFKYSYLICLPTIVVVCATASKKAFAIFILGIFLLLIYKIKISHNILSTLRKIMFVFSLFLIFGFFLWNIGLLNPIITRIFKMYNAFVGLSGSDNSSKTRLKMISIGLNIFNDNPIWGIGIDNAQIFTYKEYGISNYYLHNNYIELLADLGIIGFFIYYWFLIFLLFKFYKYRKINKIELFICFSLIIIHLVMDYGCVTYESRDNYFYWLIYYKEFKSLTAKEYLIS